MSDEHKSERDLIIEVRNDVKHLREGRHDHEQRLRSVERKQWWFAGAAAALGVVSKWFGGGSSE
jgi:hypothetical protein